MNADINRSSTRGGGGWCSIGLPEADRRPAEVDPNWAYSTHLVTLYESFFWTSDGVHHQYASRLQRR